MNESLFLSIFRSTYKFKKISEVVITNVNSQICVFPVRNILDKIRINHYSSFYYILQNKYISWNPLKFIKIETQIYKWLKPKHNMLRDHSSYIFFDVSMILKTNI